MKKAIGLSVILMAIDQSIKLCIANFFAHAHTILIPGVLLFHPVQNTNLNWIASMVDYRTSAAQMVAIQSFGILLAVFAYRYCTFCFGRKHPCLKGFLIFFITGLACSFFDVVFWGGSLDFIRLFDWFTFDLKDVYITIAVVSFLLFFIFYERWYSKLSKDERKRLREQQKLLQWFKHGCSILP